MLHPDDHRRVMYAMIQQPLLGYRILAVLLIVAILQHHKLRRQRQHLTLARAAYH